MNTQMNKQKYYHTLARLVSTKADIEAAIRKYPYEEVHDLTVAELINAVFTEGF